MTDTHKEMPEKITIQYYLPLTGAISVVLHNQSAKVYKYLESKKEITRLNKLDHLGLIREVFQGAHHSRWEYVVLILYLINEAKKVNGLHLAGEVEIEEDKISKTELMKSWAMLLNVGHLFWTFTAERALMCALKNGSMMRKQFTDRIPDPSIQQFIKQTLKEQNIYRFYQCVGFYRLNRWKRNVDGDETQKCINLLKTYCMPSSTVLINDLKALYSKIRSVAFLILDSYYISSFVELDLRDLIINSNKFAEVVGKDETPLKVLISNMEDYLYDVIYLSKKTAPLVDRITNRYANYIKRKSKESGIASPVGDMSVKTLGISPSEIPIAEKNHLMRLSFKVESPFTDALLKKCHFFSEEQSWNRHMVQNGHAMVWPLPDQHQKHVDIFINHKKNRKADIERIYYGVIQKLINEHQETKQSSRFFDDDFIQDIVYRNACLSIIRSFFKEAFEFQGNLEFGEAVNHHQNEHIQVALSASKRDSKKLLKRAIQLLGKSKATRSRRDELHALRHAITAEKAHKSLLLMANIRFYDLTSMQIGELDGFYMCLHYKKLKIVLIEAKDTHTPSKAVIYEQLKTLIEGKLRLKTESFKWQYSFHKCGQGYPDYGRAEIICQTH